MGTGTPSLRAALSGSSISKMGVFTCPRTQDMEVLSRLNVAILLASECGPRDPEKEAK